MSELERVYILAVVLRLAIVKSLAENKKLFIHRRNFVRDMNSIQVIAEWALINMSDKHSPEGSEDED